MRRIVKDGYTPGMARKKTGRTVGRPRKGQEVNKKFYDDTMEPMPDGLKYKVRVPANVLKMIRRPADEAKALAVDPEDEKAAKGAAIIKDIASLFGSLAKELPHVGAQIASLLSERARWHVMSDRFTQLAVAAGIDTPQGMLLLEKALAFSKSAESSAVKTYNLSVRLAQYEAQLRNDKPKTPWLVVEEPGSEPSPEVEEHETEEDQAE